MELYKMNKADKLTAWAFMGKREPRELNGLEVAGVETLTAEALGELFGAYSGQYFANHCAAWCGSCWCSVFANENERQRFTLAGGYSFRFACVVGLALLLVFWDKNEKERVYRVIL